MEAEGRLLRMEPIGLYEARKALEENITKHLTPKSAPALHNLNIALLGICHSLDSLSMDVALLHRKLQPILKEIGDDQATWQRATRGDG